MKKESTYCPFCGHEEVISSNAGYECPKCKNSWNADAVTYNDRRVKKCMIMATGATGSAVCINNIVNEAKAQDYDLLKTATEDGSPTGHGNMFENVVRRENPGSRKVNNPGSKSNHLLKEKDGADLELSDGRKVQAKCCRTPEKTAKSLFKNGEYRYKGQTIYVPKGQGRIVKNELTRMGVDAPVVESDKTYDEVLRLTEPGIESAKFDATNPVVLKNSLICTIIVGGCIYMYYKICKPDKRRKWYAFGGALLTMSMMVAGYVGYGQYKRY